MSVKTGIMLIVLHEKNDPRKNVIAGVPKNHQSTI